RGSLGGVLPSGFDPSSIAAQAIFDLLSNGTSPDLFTAATAPRSDAASPLSSPVRASPILSETALRRALERRVRLIVNRLHHRAENRLLRNEPALSPTTLDDGDSV